MSDRTVEKLQAENAALYEALRKAEERAVAGQFALEIMHEIRNPLEALANLIYLINHDAEDAEKVRFYTRLAEEQVGNGSRIASKTLSFAKTMHDAQMADLAAIAEAALRIHRSTLESKRIRLVKRIPETLTGMVFVGEMLQAISNLISNALDALPAEGSLHLRLRRRANKVHIVISDSGYGIPKEHVKEIFQPFYTTKLPGGTGLGLAITKSIVEKHGGSMRVRSSVREGGSGTTFRISIPA